MERRGLDAQRQEKNEVEEVGARLAIECILSRIKSVNL